jgi:hypothetical protein
MEPRRTKPRRTRPDPEPIERAPPNLVRTPAPTPHSPEREGEVSARGSRRPSLNETTLARPAAAAVSTGAAVIRTVRTADLNTGPEPTEPHMGRPRRRPMDPARHASRPARFR